MKECSENYLNITVTLKTPINCPNNNKNCVLGIQIFLERIQGMRRLVVVENGSPDLSVIFNK